MFTHMNVFHPYDRKQATHEDNLTRAFLLVLRSVPLAHSTWLDLVDKSHKERGGTGVPRLHELTSPEVSTQTSAIPHEVSTVVSVIQTDEHYFAKADLKASNRRMVLDGLVSYPPHLAIAIENKPSHRNAYDEQLCVKPPPGAAHDSKLACVTWRSIIAAWAQLLQAGHFGCAERVLVEDFLLFVEELFPQLQPYQRIHMCGASVDRLKRRCRGVLEELAPESVHEAASWGWYIAVPEPAVAVRIALIPRQDDRGAHLDLELAPADTVGQARLLYSQFDFSHLSRLEARNWRVVPNLHLAYITGNRWYPKTRLSSQAYWELWRQNAKWIRQVPKPEWGNLLEFLFANGLAQEHDKATFDLEFTVTQRTEANVCPGFVGTHSLTLDEATALDLKDGLVGRIRKEIEKAGEILRLNTSEVLKLN